MYFYIIYRGYSTTLDKHASYTDKQFTIDQTTCIASRRLGTNKSSTMSLYGHGISDTRPARAASI